MKDVKVLMVIAGLILAYPLALVLPVELGWENGLIENTQTAILLFGGILSLCAFAREPDRQISRLWLIAAPIWLILFARELSWGAVFYTPLSIDPQTGPSFSSTRQVPWKALVAPIMGIAIVFIVWQFLREKLYSVLIAQWRKRNFPLVEIVLCLVGVILCTEAENHGLIGFKSLAAGAQQLVEEWAELCAYAAIALAQWRLYLAFKVESTADVAANPGDSSLVR